MAKFEDVLPAFREGKKIRKRDWNQEKYLSLNEDTVPKIIYDLVDLLKDDWEVVEEPKKPMVYEGMIYELRDFAIRASKEWAAFHNSFYRSCSTTKKHRVTIEELGPNKEKGNI